MPNYRPLSVWDGSAFVAIGDGRVPPLMARMDAWEVRAPIAHAASHASGGSDPITAQSIGAAGGTTPTAKKTADYNAAFGELVLADAALGPFTVYLPAAAGNNSKRVAVKKVDTSANIVTVAVAPSSGDTLGSQGASSIPLRLPDQAGTYQVSGTSWVIPHGYLGLPSLDTRFVSIARQVLAGTGLTGGGALSADLTLAVAYGTAAGTAAQGNDSRLSDARVPTAHAASHKTGGSDPLTPLDIAVLPRFANVAATVNVAGDLAGDVDLNCTGDTVITMTGSPANGRTIVITCYASGAARTPSLSAAVQLAAGVASRSLALASGGKGRFILRYSTLGTAGWSLDSAYLLS
jgi:hypothetical protein